MKRKHLCAVILLCFGLTACGAEGGTEGSVPGTEEQITQESIGEPIEKETADEKATEGEAAAPEETQIAAEPEQDTDAGEADEAETDEAKNTYLGDWKVTEFAGFSSVSALSQEEADGYVGMTISYQEAFMTGSAEEDETINVSGYEEMPYQTADLVADYKVNPETLGVEEEEVLSVYAQTEEDAFGQYFFVLDEYTLLIQQEGAFFRAERIR